ncbi:thiol:disulfide interchange protein [Patiriisocius marinistellae]|uniref:Thiol:disulfide interchange protein n=1 Tax=Patiriisocius marinistellae TaxID=2494560 RepID=A0A5J4G337_9FLAO|nr:TlpA disulfide reductase family protein [Patiriisocius marinistellae]GEQ87226.1 thiol:disulfide interchange protein [Patiriisocius marinistellae]
MKFLLFIISAITLISCAGNSDTYSLQGTASGFVDETPVMVYTIKDNQTTILDTLTIKNGKFSGDFIKSETPSVHYLMINNSSILYFPETEDLTATIYKDSIQASFVSGNSQNAAYLDFRNQKISFAKRAQKIQTDYKNARTANDNAEIARLQRESLGLRDEQNELDVNFAKKNPNSIFALMLVSEMLNKKTINAVEAAELVNNFSPKIAATDMAKEIKAVAANIKNSDIGGEAPAFSAKTPDGKELALKDAMGKYTIIDFWASWCRPCRAENPNVVNVYNQYHDKGLNIISVSLDKAGQEDRWKKAISDDKMDWYHVSNLMAWQDPIAKDYSVRSIPATFLLDENGTIIAKNLRGPALGRKIASLLD